TALVSASVFFLTPLLLLVLGVRPPAFENRKLASFPSPADGWGFFTGMQSWGTDHLPLRDSAVGFEDWFSRTFFGEPPKLGDQQPQTGGPIPGPVGPGEPSASDEDKHKIRARGFARVIE